MRLEGWKNPYKPELQESGLWSMAGFSENLDCFEEGADAMYESMIKYMEEKSLFNMAHGKPIYSMSLEDYKALKGQTPQPDSKVEPIYTPADYVEVHNVNE